MLIGPTGSAAVWFSTPRGAGQQLQREAAHVVYQALTPHLI